MANIKKIKLSDGSIYSIFDAGALRLGKGKTDNESVLLTGNTIVDKIIIEGDLYIEEVDDVPVEKYEKVLVQDSATGQIRGRSKDNLLEDIGGISYNMNESEGTLSLQIGKQS